MAEPLVTACLITYNQANYIRQAVEGVLMQQTTFPWELIVADDCSTDGTRDILIEYQKKHPDRVQLLLQEKNVGPAQNWFELITTPKTRYIALCEGDDFWTDPLKLQKQVDFLEQHPDFVACFHDVKVIDSKGQLMHKSKNSFLHNRDLTSEELILGRVMSTLSLCYRNVIKEFPEEYHRSPTGDNFLCSLLGNHGKGKFLTTVEPSAYRMHAGGAWSLQSETKKKMNLLQSYFWLWLYYQRTGKPEYAKGFYGKILLEGFYSNPFQILLPTFLGRVEYNIIRFVRKTFRFIRRWVYPDGIPSSIDKNPK